MKLMYSPTAYIAYQSYQVKGLKNFEKKEIQEGAIIFFKHTKPSRQSKGTYWRIVGTDVNKQSNRPRPRTYYKAKIPTLELIKEIEEMAQVIDAIETVIEKIGETK